MSKRHVASLISMILTDRPCPSPQLKLSPTLITPLPKHSHQFPAPRSRPEVFSPSYSTFYLSLEFQFRNCFFLQSPFCPSGKVISPNPDALLSRLLNPTDLEFRGAGISRHWSKVWPSVDSPKVFIKLN